MSALAKQLPNPSGITLRDVRGRALRTPLDLSGVPLVTFAQRAVNYVSGLPSGKSRAMPTKEALEFYLSNHAMTEIERAFHLDEPLPPEAADIVEDYYKANYDRVLRAVFYLFYITAREARHGKPSYSLVNWAKERGFPEACTVHSNTPGDFSLEKFLSVAIDIPMGDWLHYLAHQFQYGGYSKNYGGKPWRKITETLRSFVMGDITPEMLLDTVFTLAHNCGNIFNKGLLYDSPSESVLRMILDVQRSGQIPQLTGSSHLPQSNAATWGVEYVNKVRAIVPNFGDGDVDWFMVRDLGALGNYPSQIGAQLKALGKSKGTPGANDIQNWIASHKKSAGISASDEAASQTITPEIKEPEGTKVVLAENLVVYMTGRKKS